MFGKHTTVKQDQSIQPSLANDLNRFSLPELRRIHNQLVENKAVNDSNQDLVVEILRIIAEIVVYGDNKSELLFDFFCEKNMLALFLEIMWSPGPCPSIVHIQILQTLSILISCVKNNTSLYYLLSNNYINDIINFPHCLTDDESLSAQYASFIKSLSLRLNDQTVQFFFIEETGAFPLLTKAVQILESDDPMIRISAQTAILNVYRVDDSRAREYALQNEVLTVLFKAIICIMNGQFNNLKRLYNIHMNADVQKSDLEKAGQSINDLAISIEDWLYYLQDIFDLNIPLLVNFFEYIIMNDFIVPTLFGAIDEIGIVGDVDSVVQNGSISSWLDKKFVNAGLYYLLQIIKIISSSSIKFLILSAFQYPQITDAFSSWTSLKGTTNPLFVTATANYDSTNLLPYRVVAHILSNTSSKCEFLVQCILSSILRSYGNWDLPSAEVFKLFQLIKIFPANLQNENTDKRIVPLCDIVCEYVKDCRKRSIMCNQLAIDILWSILKLLLQVIYDETVDEESIMNCRNGLNYIRLRILDAIQWISNHFSEKIDMHFEDSLLIVNEEFNRYRDRSWKTSFEKIINFSPLILPSESMQLDKFGADYSTPVCELEILRGEFHVLLLLRALLESSRIVEDKFISEDVFRTVGCNDFCGLQEISILGEQYLENGTFEMKGKKFLDAIIIQMDPAVYLTTPKSNSNDNASSNSSITSALTFGLLGSSKRQNRTPKSQSTESSLNAKSPQPISGFKILFVQDPMFLLLVSQQKVDGKSNFKIKVVAPLLFSEAKQDSNDKRRFNLIVRSWRKLSNMNIIELLPNDEGIATSSISTYSPYQRNAETFLKPPEKSSMYELTIVMDTEQACSLAVQHIELRRKTLSANNLEYFKNILNKWQKYDL